MTAPLGPRTEPPSNIRPPFDEPRPMDHDHHGDEWRERRRADQVAAVREALDGIELGPADESIIEWIAGWDTPTIGGIVSLLYRARQAGPAPRGRVTG